MRYVLEENSDEDHELIRWVTWTNHAGSIRWARSTGLITVFAQPPWVLTQEKLEKFASYRRVSTLTSLLRDLEVD